jgi:putative heme-binding domain-containing protein
MSATPATPAESNEFTMKLLLLCALSVCPGAIRAQSGDVEQGKAIFRSNCAFCHGLTGRGGRGPNLVSRPIKDIKSVVRNGVPGTTMPAFQDFEEADLDRLVAYIGHLSGGGVKSAPVAGDAQAGRRVYLRSGCAGCHRIGGEGSVFGPDLTRIGAARSPEYLRESLVQPSADIPPEYEGVTVTTRDGGRVSGVRVNEDTFTVQLRDASQNFRMFQKEELSGIAYLAKSLMPSYAALPKQDLDNLLAYLDTLRGEVKAGAGVKKAEGIR